MSQKIKTLDKQFDYLPNKLQFCSNCVVSNQRPRTRFNEQGICSPCEWSYEKDNIIDWEKREKELAELCDKFRSSNGSFDVVVPGSGGKDSAYVAHQLKYVYGMNPLCVTWSPFEFTNIGFKNLNNFIASGFNNILGQPDGKLHRIMTKLAFEMKGDAWEPFTYGQKAWAFHIATRFKIKLIMYGENGELEYGGSEKYKYLPKEGPEEWEYEYFKGANIDDLLDVGLERNYFDYDKNIKNKIDFYKAPSVDSIIKSESEMHWYSYYKKWVPQENFYYASKYCGFDVNPSGRSEGTYTKHVSLDDKLDGIHWYQSYAKFGMGRASRDVQTDIRRHHITRDEGVKLVNKFDGEIPRRDLNFFLDYIQISEDYFWEVIDHYRNLSNVWKKNNNSWEMIAKVV